MGEVKEVGAPNRSVETVARAGRSDTRKESMFEQAFRNIDDILRKEAGGTTELDFQKYLYHDVA